MLCYPLCEERAAVSSDHGSILKIQTAANAFSVPDARRWTEILTRYRKPSELRSTVELAITFVPLATLWVLAWAALHFGYWWLCLLLAIPAAGFLVRLFMIQHDCGHGSFFRHRMTNDWVGRVIGVLTLPAFCNSTFSRKSL